MVFIANSPTVAFFISMPQDDTKLELTYQEYLRPFAL
jgi:hypothetical protein